VHTKNVPMLLKLRLLFKHMTAYDICHAYRPGSDWVSKHALSLNGKREDITRDDCMVIAKSINIKKPNLIIDEINSVVQDWKIYSGKAGVSEELAKGIEATLLNFV